MRDIADALHATMIARSDDDFMPLFLICLCAFVHFTRVLCDMLPRRKCVSVDDDADAARVYATRCAAPRHVCLLICARRCLPD